MTASSADAHRAGALLLLVAALAPQLGACEERSSPAPAAASHSTAPVSSPAAPAPWPKLPTNRADASRLIDARTQRNVADAGQPKEWTAEEIAALLRRRQAEGRVVAGFQQVGKWLSARLSHAVGAGNDSYVLVGTHHDSALQLRAFRELLGYLELSAVSVEHFQADGHWQGVSPAYLQQGDSQVLAEFLSTGDQRAYSRLSLGRTDHNYSAYKYGLIRDVLDLALESRARGLPLVACDMPSELQKILRALPAEQVLRLRELHCLLALEDRPTSSGPRRVAMLWGQAHLAADGFARFLPPSTEITRVTLLGGRFDDSFGIEKSLARRVALTAPVLLPSDEGEAVLLLPGPELGARLEKKRTHAEHGPALIRAGSTVKGTLWVGGRSFPVGERPTDFAVPAGPTSYLLDTKSVVLVGAVAVPTGGQVELELDPRGRAVVSTLTLPR